MPKNYKIEKIRPCDEKIKNQKNFNNVKMLVKSEKKNRNFEEIWENYLKECDIYMEISERLKSRKKFYEIIEKYINHAAANNVLELGSGTGIDISVVSSRNKSIDCFASDISEKSLKIGKIISKNLNQSIKFFVSDINKIPIKENMIDIVFSQGVVEHFKNPILVIKEQLRVLKKNGILIINVPQKFTGYTIKKKILIRKNKWKFGWETEYSYNNLKKIAKILKLKEKESFGYNYYKSWGEPAFVLRDLVEKITRKKFMKNSNLIKLISMAYNNIWNVIENKYGKYFLQNIVIVYQKK